MDDCLPRRPIPGKWEELPFTGESNRPPDLDGLAKEWECSEVREPEDALFAKITASATNEAVRMVYPRIFPAICSWKNVPEV
jgi:hypothetical protein